MEPDTLEVLRKSELFWTLSEEEIQSVASRSRVVNYKAGEVIYKQGTRSDSVYIIAEGKVALKREAKEKALTIDMLSENRCFGWSSLVEPHDHTATALVLLPSKIIVVDAIELGSLMEKKPRIGYEIEANLARLLASRVRASYRAIDESLQ